MKETIARLDDRVDGLFDRLRGNAVADRVFYTASALGDFGLVWVMLALVRALRGRPNDERAAIRVIVANILDSIVVSGIMKSVFGRKRPISDIVHPHRFRQPLTSSFPSGHATAGFCAAVLLSDQDKSLSPAYFAAASVVATSRIHTKIHHASDVIGGALIGLAFGAIGRRLAPLPPKRPS